ncbi:MAG: NifB/NifX family molybdenum-iron cluster-binding protein [Firmicutes bacterium]|nr:NifB/NifX family molybdenum-iron cluster-binding protein [Bacillota bacterium]
MKIAIATDGDSVASHFGRCPAYTIYNVADGKVVSKTVIPNPGHEPGFLPRYLSNLGVCCIIAGGMGPRAQGLFSEQGIETFTGVSGSVEEAILAYLADTLVSRENLCDHEEGEHGHCHHG